MGDGAAESGGIDQYGRGDYDPVTGTYEWYEAPENFLDYEDDGESLSLLKMMEEWVLIEFDFQFVLSIDLEQSIESMSWRRFQLLLAGLFGVEKSLVRNRFRPDKTKDEQEGTDPEEE